MTARTAFAILVFACACGGSIAPTSSTTPTPPRTTIPLDDAFAFRLADDGYHGEAKDADESGFERVTLPHTFGDRSKPFPTSRSAWYRAHVRVETDAPDRRFFLHFGGVGTVARVWVDGREVGSHRGAYTGFTFDVTAALTASALHVIAVKVDNTDDGTADCLPGRALERNYFRPWGGLYRTVELVAARALRIGDEAWGASGVRFVTSAASPASATVDATVRVENDGPLPERGQVRITLSHSGTTVTELVSDYEVDPGATSVVPLHAAIVKPALWDLGAPELYDATVELVDASGIRDRVRERFGIRRFEHTGGTYLLNGHPVALRGISKHQESEKHFAAMRPDEFRAEWDDLVSLGVNFVRLVHYPHADLEYSLADERGLLVWAENGNSAPGPGTDTGERITREMVRQLQNHPSIVMWSAGNESAADGPSSDAIVRYAKAAKAEDPSRLVVYANNTNFSDPALDVLPSNAYPGWYGGDVWDFEKLLPTQRDFSETGGRSVVTHHTDYADAHLDLSTFEPEEYLQRLAESRMHVAFRSRAADISMFTWWVYRDFVLDGRPKGINDSGLVSFDGLRKKDVYWLFRCFLRPDLPQVHLASAAYFVRRGRANNGIKAYSNAKRLRLLLDGVDQGTRDNGAFEHSPGRFVDDVFFWAVPLRRGTNHVVITDDDGHDDAQTIVFDGVGGLPPLPGPERVSNLGSSNAANRAVYFDGAPSPGFPLFTDLDGTADESWGELPPELATAHPIATRRTSKVGNATALTFTITTNATVFVAVTDGAAMNLPGFTDQGVRGTWHDDTMAPVAMRVFRRPVAANETLTLPAQAAVDYVVLVGD